MINECVKNESICPTVYNMCILLISWIVIGQRPADFLSDHTEIIFFFSICIYEYTRISWFIISFWRFWELVSPLQDINIFLRIKFQVFYLFIPTVFSATQRRSIVATLFRIVTLQRCVALKIVVANRPV